VILTNLVLYLQVLDKTTNIKLNKIPFGGNRVISWRRNDGRTDVTDYFSKDSQNAELFRMKLKSFSLSAHSAQYMNIV
jgi:hypothetical protein